tara:strand:+ start:793 stop:963 length:171 start_codon:yes stop_codon:yes gene_type:complete
MFEEIAKIKGKHMVRRTAYKPKKGKKNIPNNFRGKEDRFWTKVVNGLKAFLKSPFK